MGMLPYMMGGFGGGAGAGAGAGLGAGLLGGILGGALLGGGGGLFGNRGTAGDFVTTAGLQSALNQQSANTNTNAILQNLATIQAEIPASECRTNLAIASAQNAIQSQHTQQSLASASLNAATNQLISGVESALGNQVRNAHDVLAQGINGLQLQAAQNTYALNAAIRDDGDKTRSLINSINETNLNRIITTQANKIIELQGDRSTTANGLTITQNVNQTQMQMQQQQQQQQQLILLSQIATGLANVTQIAHATNSNVIAGNTGAVTTGAQTSTPTNVNTAA
jgi:hypothetical protein